MFVKVDHPAHAGGAPLNLRCPACGQHGTFGLLPSIPDLYVSGVSLGQRRCPNRTCLTHIFFVANGQQVLRTYPPLRIDFDSSNIPEKVAASLRQAVTCHAEECHVAAAIMVRRCLEELCFDRNATGGSLKDRIASLRTKIVVPEELLEAIDELRLLGNDAAHVEAKTYDSIGKPEVEAAIEVTKEILKAVYQLDTLVQRLKALKKAP